MAAAIYGLKQAGGWRLALYYLVVFAAALGMIFVALSVLFLIVVGVAVIHDVIG